MKKIKRLKFENVVLTFLFILLFTEILSAPVSFAKGTTDKLTKVSLQLKWKHQFQFAGYYAAIKKGFYRDAGLLVNLKEPESASDAIDFVVNGKAEFGIAGSDLVLRRSQGLPVVALAAIYQHSPLAIAASVQSGITHIHDFKGKRLALEIQSADIQAMFQAEGLPISKIKLLQHKFNPKDLIDGKVDALSIYTTDKVYELRKAGLDHRIISPRSYGIDFYGDTLFTSTRLIRERPELVKSFRDASLKGWRYALNHTKEIVDFILDRYGDRHSREHLNFEAEKTKGLIIPDIVEIGYMHTGRWRYILETYQEIGLVPENQSIDFDEFVYTAVEKPDYSRIYMLIGVGSGVLALVMTIAISFFRLNRRLKKQISEGERLTLQLKKKTLLLNNINVDLTYAKEALQRSNAELQNFACTVSHDLQEPLRKIITFGDRVEADDEINADYIKRIQNSALLMQKLIDDLLEYSMVKVKTNPFRRVDLNKTVNDVLEILENRIRTTNGKINLNPLPSLDADPIQMQQLFQNLIGNSLKYHKKGLPPVVNITSIRNEEDGSWQIELSDNGIGFDDKHYAKIFEPFERLHEKSAYEGSGMGLAICRRIIESHSGIINVKSKVGEGTTFAIILPESQNAGSDHNADL